MSQLLQEGDQQMDEDPPQPEQPQPPPRHQAIEVNELLDSSKPPPIDWESLLPSIEHDVRDIKQEMGKIHKKIDWCLVSTPFY
ncbi:unnamed protein product [Cylicostephanus goldi]|uniref:Uncharacterized protein n=1 Tax=Cylicostephanus goldi TaxID=71465 RepID=A0A3P7NUB5_CYLGO|nr:unnamed protein product [Cylicostephanus goldi]